MGTRSIMPLPAKAYDAIKAYVDDLIQKVPTAGYQSLFCDGTKYPRIDMNEIAVERMPEEIDPSFEAKLRIFLHENTEPSVAGIDRTLVERVIRAWERMK